MANTFTKINIHVVFAVKSRENLLFDHFKDDLFKYISGILKNNNQFPLAVNGYRDHVHLFFELHPTSSLSEIIKIVKANSSKWINSNKFVDGYFEWQQGYSAFSYSKTQRDGVIKYIINQEQHHKFKTFREEYVEILKKFDIKFENRYIFDFYE